MIDVLIAGGGPAGLATAICCARAGLSVIVAEPRAAPVDKACGEGLMPAAVRRLAALGVRPEGHPLRGIRYAECGRADPGPRTREPDDPGCAAEARFRGSAGLGVRRTTLQAALRARAAEFGIAAGEPSIDFAGNQRRKVAVVDQLFRGLSGLLKGRKVTTLSGTGCGSGSSGSSLGRGDRRHAWALLT